MVDEDSKTAVAEPEEECTTLVYSPNQFSGTPNTQVNKAKFLRVYRCNGNMSEASKAVGVHRTTVYRWLTTDPYFAAAHNDCKEEAVYSMELELRSRGMEGVPAVIVDRFGNEHHYMDKGRASGPKTRQYQSANPPSTNVFPVPTPAVTTVLG